MLPGEIVSEQQCASSDRFPRRILRRFGHVVTNISGATSLVILSSQLLTASGVSPDTASISDVPLRPDITVSALSADTESSTDVAKRTFPTHSATPTQTANTINASCRDTSNPVSVDWPVMGMVDVPIEKIGFDPRTGGMAKTKSEHTLGVFTSEFAPKVGSNEGYVLTGGERYRQGGSVFPTDYEQRLATVAIGSIVTFSMGDSGKCSYEIDVTHPHVFKFSPKPGSNSTVSEYTELIENENYYRYEGPPGIFIEGCTGPYDPRNGTSDGMGIAVGHKIVNTIPPSLPSSP